MAELPRVLVISTVSFNLEAGGGVTMSNLFRGWPTGRIAQIYSHGVNNKDLSVCRTYYHVPAVARQLEWMEGRPLFMSGLTGRSLRRARAGRLTDVPQRFQESIAFAKRFRPDVAYVRPMDKPSSYWWLCRDLCRLLGIPYVTHIMDDWPARYALDARTGGSDDVPAGVKGRLKAGRLDRSMRRLFRDAAANLAISPEMAAGYHERYGERFLPFHNSVDVADWEARTISKPAAGAGSDRPFVIRYIGAVVADKELESLREIAKAAMLLNDEGRQVRFEIHCGPAWNTTVDTHLASPPTVTRGAFLSQDDLPAVLSSADLLVLPMNFDDRSIRYVGYSMQTKGPEYMASGTPILVYGPPSNPNVRYAKDGQWAMVVDRHDPDGTRLASTIRSLMDHPERGEELGRRGRAVARANHDAPVVRERFREVLRRAAASR